MSEPMETHYFGDGHDHTPSQVQAIADQMQADAAEYDRLEEAETEQRLTLAIPLHHLSVVLGRRNGWGLDYGLTCPGEPATSLCHWWREVEGDPTSFVQHAECSILDWFENDTASFIEDYTGVERDRITSGPIEIYSWGEDGFEWDYPADPEGQFERERVRSAVAPHIEGSEIDGDALVDDIMAELAGEQ